MNKQDFNNLLDLYETKLKKNYDSSSFYATELNHIIYMIPTMREILENNNTDKFMRWFGFVQGACYVLGIFTIVEMRQHVIEYVNHN